MTKSLLLMTKSLLLTLNFNERQKQFIFKSFLRKKFTVEKNEKDVLGNNGDFRSF